MINLHKVPKLAFLAVPGLVFLLVLGLILTKIPKSPPTQTEVVVTPTTGVISPTPVSSRSPLQNFVQAVSDLQINDPQLAAPNFDRKIFLPAEN